MFCMLKKRKVYPVYVSKHNSNCEKHVIILIISNREVWHYLAVKKLSALSGGITFKNHGDFYYLNCLHFLTTEKKLQLHKRLCENKYICYIIMPSEDTK